jgi:hypothetical protein
MVMVQDIKPAVPRGPKHTEGHTQPLLRLTRVIMFLFLEAESVLTRG